MTKASYLIPDNRGVLAVGGNDRHSFLQGLISNDINKVTADRALWSAFLTPQGKYLHDFFIAEIGDVFYIDCEFARRQDLLKRLSLYKLRSKVTVGDATETHAVAVVYGEDALALPQLIHQANHRLSAGHHGMTSISIDRGLLCIFRWSGRGRIHFPPSDLVHSHNLAIE